MKTSCTRNNVTNKWDKGYILQNKTSDINMFYGNNEFDSGHFEHVSVHKYSFMRKRAKLEVIFTWPHVIVACVKISSD